MKVCFVAAPLTARSGVYRSARELVTEGRAQGHDWSLLLGVSNNAAGEAPRDDPDWISEIVLEPTGLAGVHKLSRLLRSTALVTDSAMIVSLIPQTDMALANSRLPWVAYARGLPWPAPGEVHPMRGLIWRLLERLALRRARKIWATTDVLRHDLAIGTNVRLVPAGIAHVPRQWDGRGHRSKAVWAARYDEDKNPQLFLDVLRSLPIEAVMYGSGRMEESLRQSASGNVSVSGWAPPSELWNDAFVYVGTSNREAFGRSAVEAAMSGIPVVLADTFGAASLLITDPDLQEHFVLPVTEPSRWAHALRMLSTDEAIRMRLSQHVSDNAMRLTISGSVQGIARALEDASSTSSRR